MRAKAVVTGLWLVSLAVMASGAQVPTAPPGPAPVASPAATAATTGEPATPASAPVVFAGKTLFTVRTGVGSFGPQARAAAVVSRIERIASNPLLGEVKVSTVAGQDGYEIRHGRETLIVVTPSDARAADTTLDVLATQWTKAIGEAIEVRHQAFGLHALLIGTGAALLATILLITFLKLLSRVVPAATKAIDAARGSYIPSIKVQRLVLVSADRLAGLAKGLVRLVRVVLVVLALYVYVPSVFGFFPWTADVSRTLFGYTLTPLKVLGQAFVAFLPNLFFLAVIAVLTFYGVRFVRFVFREIEHASIILPGFDAEWAGPTYKIVRFLVVIFAVIFAYPYLPGSSSKAFQGVSIFLGVLLSLGSSSAVANAVSGVILTYTGAFKLGDRVQIADTVGDVIGKTLLVTRVRTIKNVEITVPNSMVLGSHIINYSAAARQRGLILHTTVTIGYDAPWRRVHELLVAAALRTPHVVEEPAPFVLQLSLDDYYPTYELNAYTDDPWRMATTYSELHQNIQDTFNEAGVEIMSPAYHGLRDGNAIAIPEEYRPVRYQPPAFRVSPSDQARSPAAPAGTEPGTER
ncbi:MAG: mechanosensitive ion channel family protein [Acidobacteriota bacterium]